MKAQIYSFLTCMSATGVLGAVGGYEQDMFGFGGLVVRVMAFALLTYFFGSMSIKNSLRV